MAAKATVTVDDRDFPLYEADLAHLADAAAAMRKQHQYTAAQRIDAIAAMVRQYLTEDA